MEIDIKSHCTICDNRIYDFQTGAICGLTNEAPNFSQKCKYIKPEKKLEEKIVEVHTKLKLVTKTKTDTISHFIFFTILNILIVTVYYFLVTYDMYNGYVPGIRFVIVGSLCLLGIAIGPIHKYRRDYKIAKNNKERLDALLKIYKLDYEVSVDIINEAHGDYDVEKQVKIFRVG
ncbi:hypothetical protein [Kordia jejudonensis]|uniref:hypothetical protein n=1 Tax=Kordia jejudonensis TaxID=1348245 RepID=UPI000629C19E|nr:hypothetical protein [Kordia jejudonensis]